jgi:hypothetical protein
LITFNVLNAAKTGSGLETLDPSGFAGAFPKLSTMLSTGFVDISLAVLLPPVPAKI